MTPHELARDLAALRWSARQLALATGRPAQRGHDWMARRFAVPSDVAQWLATMAEHMRNNPPPQRRKPTPAPTD